jgi:hypothetical protein
MTLLVNLVRSSLLLVLTRLGSQLHAKAHTHLPMVFVHAHQMSTLTVAYSAKPAPLIA